MVFLSQQLSLLPLSRTFLGSLVWVVRSEHNAGRLLVYGAGKHRGDAVPRIQTGTEVDRNCGCLAHCDTAPKGVLQTTVPPNIYYSARVLIVLYFLTGQRRKNHQLRPSKSRTESYFLTSRRKSTRLNRPFPTTFLLVPKGFEKFLRFL